MLENIKLDEIIYSLVGEDYCKATDPKHNKPQGKLWFTPCKVSYKNFKYRNLSKIKGRKVYLLKPCFFLYGMASTAFQLTVGLIIDLALFLFSDLPKGIKISSDYFKYRVFSIVRRLESSVGCLVYPFHRHLGHFLVAEGGFQHGKYREACAEIPEIKRLTKKFKQLDLDNIDGSQLKQTFPRSGSKLSRGVFTQAITADVLNKIQDKLPDEYYDWITTKQAAGLDPLKLSEQQWENMSVEVRKLLVKRLDLDKIDSNQLKTVFTRKYERNYPSYEASSSRTVFMEAITADDLKKIQEKLPYEYYGWITPKQAEGLDLNKIRRSQWWSLQREIRELLLNAVPEEKILALDTQITSKDDGIFCNVACILGDLSEERRRSFGIDIYKEATRVQLNYLFKQEEFNQISDEIFDVVKNKIPKWLLETLPIERFKKIDIDHYLDVLGDKPYCLFNQHARGEEGKLVEKKFALLNLDQVQKILSKDMELLVFLSLNQISVFDFKGYIDKWKNKKASYIDCYLNNLFSDDDGLIIQEKFDALTQKQKQEIKAFFNTISYDSTLKTALVNC